MRAIGQSAAKVSGGTIDVHCDRVDQADTDVVACVGIDNLDILTIVPAGADFFVGSGDAAMA